MRARQCMSHFVYDLCSRQLVHGRPARVRGEIASDHCRSDLITGCTLNCIGPGRGTPFLKFIYPSDRHNYSVHTRYSCGSVPPAPGDHFSSYRLHVCKFHTGILACEFDSIFSKFSHRSPRTFRLFRKNRKLALVGIIPNQFSSLSAATKIEELTAGSDENTQRNPATDRTQGLVIFSRTL